MLSSTQFRLSIMMFFQFFIWGAWYVTAPNYLSTIGFTGEDFGWTYAVGPIAGMLTPFFVGMIADRFFAAQKLLGVLHLLGGGAMLLATTFMINGQSPSMINLVFFGYTLTYFPTLSLTAAIAMRHMNDSKKEYPLVRVFGTIGWIVAGLTISWLSWDRSINMFYLCAGAAFLLGVFSIFLPDTSPEKKGEKVTFAQIMGVDALVLLKNRSYLVFLISSFLICIPLAFYYQLGSRVVELQGLPIAMTMSYGQMSEILFMLAMPFFFKRLGIKWMLVIGMACWALRYLLFTVGASQEISWMIISGVVLHGICYDYFFVTGQIYTDKIAPKSIRAQAQGLVVFVTLGIGMFTGAKIAGAIETYSTPAVAIGHSQVVQEMSNEIFELKKMEDPDSAKIGELLDLVNANRHKELSSLNWKLIWGIPAAMAFIVLIIFTLLFREENNPVESPETDES